MGGGGGGGLSAHGPDLADREIHGCGPYLLRVLHFLAGFKGTRVKDNHDFFGPPLEKDTMYLSATIYEHSYSHL